MSLSHGHRAPDRVFVHEMSLSHGHRGTGPGCERSVGLRYDLPGPQVPQRQHRRAKHHQPISYRSPSNALVGLRHGHPAYKYLSGIPSCRSISKPTSAGLYPLSLSVFGTATMPTSASETSRRGEEGFYQHFGTGALN